MPWRLSSPTSSCSAPDLFTCFIGRREHTVDRLVAVEDSWMLGRAFATDLAQDSVRALSAGRVRPGAVPVP